MIISFIDEMRQQGFTVESVCRVLREQGCQIAARTYRAWRTRPPSARAVSDARVRQTVEELAFTTDAQGRRRLTPEGLYGRRKMLVAVRNTGIPATPGAVDRAMRALGLNGVRRGRRVRTTIPTKNGKRAGDLLNRDFTATAPNRVWVTDFTYVRTWAGFVYVVFIVDVFSQRILAWHAATRKDVSLVETPLRIALWERHRQGHPIQAGQLIHHSDAGSQYTSIRYTEHLELEGITGSIGSVGDAYDNALMETINGLYKTECIHTTIFHDGPYTTCADVEYATASWVDWYNNRRLHSTLDYTTPAHHETIHYAATVQEKEPA
ncbi:IS3 family transposase [Arachnia propionica]|uniref:IS3 family transposase n=1 Tax=Arachnia propionica TaxID=1750 RepID=A0A3P1WKD1_9ACTN|nr:IS3 family transposase [Arachnia propionica]